MAESNRKMQRILFGVLSTEDSALYNRQTSAPAFWCHKILAVLCSLYRLKLGVPVLNFWGLFKLVYCDNIRPFAYHYLTGIKKRNGCV